MVIDVLSIFTYAVHWKMYADRKEKQGFVKLDEKYEMKISGI
jgi:hypothetical protein